MERIYLAGTNGEIYVCAYDLKGISEIVRENPDGSHTVVVNSCLSRRQQLKAIAHALGHVQRNDWGKLSAGQIELTAHGGNDDILRYIQKADDA